MLATFKSMNFIKNSEISLLAFAFFLNLPHLMRSSFFFNFLQYLLQCRR